MCKPINIFVVFVCNLAKWMHVAKQACVVFQILETLEMLVRRNDCSCSLISLIIPDRSPQAWTN